LETVSGKVASAVKDVFYLTKKKATVIVLLDVTEDLTPEMVKSERAVEVFRKLEENTYHYGMSTRSLFTLMAQRGPSYLHAGTNSETGLLATNKYNADVLRFPLVFIFPSDGTFWSGNPFCVLDAEWVMEEQREAAALYHEWLVGKEAQEKAIDIGLRPVTDIELHAPIALESSPETIPALETVSGKVASAVKDVFYLTKKKATVIVLLDVSSSMSGAKIRNAVEATANFVKRLARDDEVYVYTFGNEVTALQPAGRAGDVAETLAQSLRQVSAKGSTVLYDAVCQAVETANRLQAEDATADERRLYGIVVLSDGKDTASGRTKKTMYDCLPSGEDVEGVKVFTIAYGADADEGVLKETSTRTNGKAFTGDPETIEQVYLAISFEQ
jgi:Ca-activated chloride channel family protein